MGRYYEDFTVGDTYKHWPGRTVSAADNTWFTLLTMNQHPVHFDEEYAKKTEFGKPLVNSTLTLAIAVGMSVADVSQHAVANLGWTDIAMPAPKIKPINPATKIRCIKKLPARGGQRRR